MSAVRTKVGQAVTKRHHIVDDVITLVIRAVVASAILTCLIYSDFTQEAIDRIWKWLYYNQFYNYVCFETVYVISTYVIFIPIYPYVMSLLRCLDKYKIEKSVNYKSRSVKGMFLEGVVYVIPLFMADLYKIKYHFGGVDPKLWEERQKQFFQTTVALPVKAPSLFELTYQTVGSVIVYDAVFFVIHNLLHRNMFLYKHIHSHHHNHEHIHPHVTNQLNLIERGLIIVTANYSLKAVGAHPLARMLFVQIYITVLIDSHIGYDVPWGIHRVIPFNLVGGSPNHYAHHVHGVRNYQPIFTYLDNYMHKHNNLDIYWEMFFQKVAYLSRPIAKVFDRGSRRKFLNDSVDLLSVILNRHVN